MPRTAKGKRQKVSPSLRGFADAKKSKIDLLKDVRTHVVAQNVLHGEDHRSKDQVHVSEIVKGACPRMLFYKITDVAPTDAVPGVFSQLISIWSAGSAEHEKWQRWLREMGDLWGTWTCLLCEHAWEGMVPEQCPKCDSGPHLIRYDEVNLHVDSVNLVGHADGAIPRLKSLVEIKSFSAGSVRVENPGLVAEHTHKVEGRSVIDQEALWKAVMRPLLSHLLQGLFYLWMCREMGLPYEKIIFIYENKTTQATKSFEVTLSERRLLPFLDSLTEIKEAADTGVAPPRPRLYALDAKPCNACPFRTKCYQVEESNDEDSQESPAVSSRRSRPRSTEAGGEAEVRPSRPPHRADPGSPRRRDRTRGQRSRGADDGLHEVGRAPERTTRARRGGREVGGRGEGEVQVPRFARRHREGRDED